jgi:hypothetical protein
MDLLERRLVLEQPPMRIIQLILMCLFALPALAESQLDVVEFKCVTNNGITITGRDSGRTQYGRIVMDVETNWLGFKKSFNGTSHFTVQPDDEISITLQTSVGRSDGSLYFLRGKANPNMAGEQQVILYLLQPGYMGMHSPGGKIMISAANCHLVFRDPAARATTACEPRLNGR